MNGCHRFGGNRNRLTDRAGMSFCRIHNTDKILAMAVSKQLLDVLICPVCKGELQVKEDQTAIKCLQCQRVYPIRDDIPIMMKDQATFEA